MIEDLHIDVTAIVGLVVMGLIGVIAVQHGADGMTVGAGVAGAIGGWLTKAASSRTMTRQEAQPPATTTTTTEHEA